MRSTITIANRLELEPYTRGRGDVGGMVNIPVGQSVPHTAVHHTGVHIEALAQAIVRIEGHDVFGAAAGSGHVAVAAGVHAGGVAVLLVAVVRGGQIQIRDHRISDARPEHLQGLVVDVRRLGAALNVDEGDGVVGD